MAKKFNSEDETSKGEQKRKFRPRTRVHKGASSSRKDAASSKRASSNKSGYHSGNDISWYTLTPELLNSTTKLNFNIPTGELTSDLYSFDDFGSITSGNISADVYLQPSGMDEERGVLSIDLVPTYGIARSNTDALNKAAMVLYNTERAANASVASFDATDNMKVVLAYDSGLAWLAFLKRLYGTISNFAFINKFTPHTLIRAMGVDFDDIMQHRLDLLNHINLLVSRMKAFVMPNGMTIMDRHEYLFEHIFMDVANPKGYFMLYNPRYLWMYKAVQQTGDLCLESLYIGPIKDISTNTMVYMKYADLVQISEMIIGSWNDQDFVTIGAEMLKAFDKIGGNARRTVLPIPEDYTVQFEYDLNWLSQVQNMDWFTVKKSTYSGNLPATNDWRKGGTTVSNVNKEAAPYEVREIIPTNPATSPYLSTFASYYSDLPTTYGNHILLSRLSDVTPDDIMYSTRLMYNEEVDWQSTTFIEQNTNEFIMQLRMIITSCGSELPVGVTLFARDEPFDIILDPSYAIYASDGVSNWVNQNANYQGSALLHLTNADRYNFHPQIKLFQAVLTNQGTLTFSVNSALPAADLDNFAVMSTKQLSWMHDVALQALCMVRLSGIENQFK